MKNHVKYNKNNNNKVKRFTLFENLSFPIWISFPFYSINVYDMEHMCVTE